MTAPGPPRTPGRGRTYVVLGCVVAAGAALFAASRTWAVETVVRAAPLPPVVTPHTGAGLSPALPALALVALAGAGGLLAARGRGRQVVAGLVLLTGLGLTVLAAGKLGVAAGWALLTALAGVAVAAVGFITLLRGAGWPSLGARYERQAVVDERQAVVDERQAVVDAAGPRAAAGRVERPAGSGQVDTPSQPNGAVASMLLWDAIERGDDPTKQRYA